MSLLPTRRSEAIFRVKAAALQARRVLLDCGRGVRRLARPSEEEATAWDFEVAISRTPLRTRGLSAAERALEDGKIQNLRAAAARLDGVLLGAGAEFSFWKHVGRATPRRGFTRGRLLREGCLVPAVGGGLCQMSNALYEVALQANLEIIERYAHSRVVPGSAAQTGRDATVAWNYIDLRFSTPRPLLLQVRLARDELVVRLLARKQAEQVLAPPSPSVPATPPNFIPLTSVVAARPRLDALAHSCASCAQESCFRHEPHLEADSTHGRTLFLLDETWPEFLKWTREESVAGDLVSSPRPISELQNSVFEGAQTAPAAALLRSLQVRRARDAPERNMAQFRGAQVLAHHLTRAIPPRIERIVIAQSFLPWAWRAGVLGGRRFDVLMTRPPLREIHARLDAARAAFPERIQLGDYRAPAELVQLEERALAQASTCVSPHAHLLDFLEARGHHVTRLPWHREPHPLCSGSRSRAITFPGPTLARKGAHDVRDVARALNLEVVLLGAELEGADFWNGVRTRRLSRGDDSWMSKVACVVQPALLEEQPRALLRALASGLPVCGDG
jgi:hypothetical protein